jgi:hypothetical protein
MKLILLSNNVPHRNKGITASFRIQVLQLHINPTTIKRCATEIPRNHHIFQNTSPSAAYQSYYQTVCCLLADISFSFSIVLLITNCPLPMVSCLVLAQVLHFYLIVLLSGNKILAIGVFPTVITLKKAATDINNSTCKTNTCKT